MIKSFWEKGQGVDSCLVRPTYSGVGVHVDSAVLERPDRPGVQCQVALRCQMEFLNFSIIDIEQGLQRFDLIAIDLI